MADEIDRSVEPKLGADEKKNEELPPGVRVRARNKKDAGAKKDASAKKDLSPSAKKSTKSNKSKEEKKTSATDSKLEKSNDTSSLEKKISDVELKINSLSENLVDMVRAMEESGSKLNEQENQFSESINKFEVYKESQKKASTVVVISSIAAMLISIMFLVYAIFSFSTKTDFFDSVSTALGTRIVDMNDGLSSFDQARAQLSVLQEQIEGLELRLEESQLSYVNTEQDIEGQLLNYTQDINQEINGQTANLRENLTRLDGQFSAFNAQILDFGDVLEQSEVKLNEIGSEARSMNELKEIMNALLTLEKERYYEAINGRPGQNNGIGGSNGGNTSAEGMPTFNRYYTQ